MDIKDLLINIKNYVGKEIVLTGWVRNHRKQKNIGFIVFNDGTCQNSIQLVYDDKNSDFDEISKVKMGAALEVKGLLQESSGGGQDFEVLINSCIVLGDCMDGYPLQAKGRPTREFLRTVAYLRPRTNLFRAVFRVRSVAAMAIHNYFQENNYIYFNSPIITGDDCEGSGEMFKITTLDMNNLPMEDKKVDFKKDLFGQMAYITGTGQLHGEAFAMAFKKIYTFGPTFRSENSNTKNHANEFWMIEPEIAFCDLEGLMEIEENLLKYVVKDVLNKCPDEIAMFDKFVEKGLIEKLNKVIDSKFVRITHEEAIALLKKANVKWEFEPEYGEDIAKEHEKYITEYYNSPVFITNWPKDIKAFYMKLNEDGKTVAAVDLEVPGSGELMGGSQREEDYDKLINRMKEMNIPLDDLDWYTKLRLYGGCYHSGFGLGFERLLMYLTGIDNIRDVIPFPRTPGN